MFKLTGSFGTDTVTAIVRHAATFIGGYMAINGYLITSQEQGFIGSVVTLAGIAWSIYQKKNVVVSK